jgi:hypothetical protein
MMRPSLRDTDIESQGARPVPREIDVRVWIVIAAIIALLLWLI